MKKLSQEEYLNRAIQKFGKDIDYSKTFYKNKNIKINYFCKICKKEYEQLPLVHLRRSCKICSRKKAAKLNKMCQPITTEQFIEKAKKIHGDKYDYSLAEYKNKFSNIKIICNRCGNQFEQEARVHISGSGCTFCETSKGENKIIEILNKNQLEYVHIQKFPNLKDKGLLSYDFYVSKLNLLIEYNGEQHYKNVFEKPLHEWHRQLHHDWLKRQYAKKYGITLLVIPYCDFKNIDAILEENISLKRNP